MTQQNKRESKAMFGRLVLWRNAEAARENNYVKRNPFMSWPEAWYDDPHWFCANGHVCGRYLKSEERGFLCLACGEPVCMGPVLTEDQFAMVLMGLRRKERPA